MVQGRRCAISQSRERKRKARKELRKTLFGSSARIPYQNSYEYQCQRCGQLEQVPVSAIELIGALVERDDSTLPTFACDSCEGTIVPTKYPYRHDRILPNDVLGLDFEIGGAHGEVCACCGQPF